MSLKGKILVTGGAGFIGSHTVIELYSAGYEVAILDNFCNASRICLERVEKIVGKKIELFDMDLKNIEELRSCLHSNKFIFVIHFAALKAVGESCEIPLTYYENNICGLVNLLKVMSEVNLKKLVFSSSATVYTSANKCPHAEDSIIGLSSNPYGTTKFFCETILQDLVKSDSDWSVVILRYFNPVGAHQSALIGEDPSGIPKNLVPFITKVVVGTLPELAVFGSDYDTVDGSCVRDYIHVVDLGVAHVKALVKLEENGCHVYNVGTGKGTTVFQLIKVMEEVCGKSVPFCVEGRRQGDAPEAYCDPSKAERELGWKATRGLKEMCQDALNWQKQNPKGFLN